MEKMKAFESFCKEYDLDYDFTKLGYTYAAGETHKAFIIFKYSYQYRSDTPS